MTTLSKFTFTLNSRSSSVNGGMSNYQFKINFQIPHTNGVFLFIALPASITPGTISCAGTSPLQATLTCASIDSNTRIRIQLQCGSCTQLDSGIDYLLTVNGLKNPISFQPSSGISALTMYDTADLTTRSSESSASVVVTNTQTKYFSITNLVSSPTE